MTERVCWWLRFPTVFTLNNIWTLLQHTNGYIHLLDYHYYYYIPLLDANSFAASIQHFVKINVTNVTSAGIQHTKATPYPGQKALFWIFSRPTEQTNIFLFQIWYLIDCNSETIWVYFKASLVVNEWVWLVYGTWRLWQVDCHKLGSLNLESVTVNSHMTTGTFLCQHYDVIYKPPMKIWAFTHDSTSLELCLN